MAREVLHDFRNMMPSLSFKLIRQAQRQADNEKILVKGIIPELEDIRLRVTKFQESIVDTRSNIRGGQLLRILAMMSPYQEGES